MNIDAMTLKDQFIAMKQEMKSSIEIISREEKKIQALKSEFYKKISNNVAILVKNHISFKDNLFVLMLRDPKFEKDNSYLKDIHVNSADCVSSYVVSSSNLLVSRDIRFKYNVDGKGTEIYVRLYKNFFEGELNSRRGNLQFLLGSYLSLFEIVDEDRKNNPQRRKFEFHEYAKACRQFKMHHLIENFDTFNAVVGNINKKTFEKEIEEFRKDELVKKTLRVLRK